MDEATSASIRQAAAICSSLSWRCARSARSLSCGRRICAMKCQRRPRRRTPPRQGHGYTTPAELVAREGAATIEQAFLAMTGRMTERDAMSTKILILDGHAEIYRDRLKAEFPTLQFGWRHGPSDLPQDLSGIDVLISFAIELKDDFYRSAAHLK